MSTNANQLPPQNPTLRPKKKTRNPSQWRSNVTKRARLAGELYVNGKGDVVPPKARVEVDCKCRPPCKDKLSQQEQNAIFDEFRGMKSHEEQTLFLRSCVTSLGPVANAYSYEYRLTTSTQASIRICQKFLLGLLDIKKSRLRRKVLNWNKSVQDGRGKHNSRKTIHPDAIAAVRLYLHSLEPRESHYSRAHNQNRTYLESDGSISGLYKDFLQKHAEYSPFNLEPRNVQSKKIKQWCFEKIFNYEFNLSFGYPRSDICETCESNKVKQRAAEIENDQVVLTNLRTAHDNHLSQAQNFYTQMGKNEISQLPDDVACLCFDFEKNLPLPVTNVTREFFSRQLWLYNFGIHDIRSGNTSMYIYSETFCHKGPNEVISCLSHYFENVIPLQIKKLRLFSDNSGGQNKNRFLLAFLSSLSDRFEEITFSFPIVGHSRMACDRAFARVEQLKRKKDKMYFPSDWTKLIRGAQPNLPFQVSYVEHPLTDDLADDGTPIVKVFDYKVVLGPILKAPKGIMTAKGFRFDRVGRITSRKSTDGPYNDVFNILKRGVTIDLLKNTLRMPPPAYSSYVPMKKVKYQNVTNLLENVHVPLDKIFYETMEAAEDEVDLSIDEEEEDEEDEV